MKSIEEHRKMKNKLQNKWRANNPGKIRKYEKTYAEKYPEKLKLKERKRTLRKYGLTLEQYDALLSSQNGVSAIAGDPYSGFVVDHDHKTGVVRGLISSELNAAIGAFGDSPDLLEAAAKYLRERTPR
jgi:Autographiviridae endonuclease VII